MVSDPQCVDFPFGGSGRGDDEKISVKFYGHLSRFTAMKSVDKPNGKAFWPNRPYHRSLTNSSFADYYFARQVE